jgi:hypothetical protein
MTEATPGEFYESRKYVMSPSIGVVTLEGDVPDTVRNNVLTLKFFRTLTGLITIIFELNEADYTRAVNGYLKVVQVIPTQLRPSRRVTASGAAIEATAAGGVGAVAIELLCTIEIDGTILISRNTAIAFEQTFALTGAGLHPWITAKSFTINYSL